MREAQSNRVNKPLSEETKRKISEAHKARGIRLTIDAKPKIFEKKIRTKYVVSDATRAKLREARKNLVITDETRRKISEANRGQVRSEEARTKMMEAHERRDYNRPIMTPNGKFISKESLKQRLVADGIKTPTAKIREWFKVYPNDYYYIK